ncbi:MAG: DNA mismatch repair endonuclease MutL [Lunatimonas sp.]|uniref:DNA mismatch repair endonuclease MutL n=1 Tax=Lunatimonas sp. TaxID=2060141 RepID=UPI00263BA3F7|nr:DNA mismatch repair endonuclease MutL [Lunatimonas sp.]MCC5938388.1 DNA mismatch repair endonuclease MutL [Lunatimonas sp.]
MNDLIQLLPDAIANQIAAGEVVQRPASALKELLENCLDAGAKNIKVIVKEGGKQLIQVIDDGIGMSLTDARMSFERHATSKIRKSDDLFCIRTFGFRGEALASIAAVAQVEMKTKRPQDELGTLLCIEGSEVKKQEPISCADGTSISVKNLFFNVPARRNFLKSNAVETKHLVEEFQRVALSYPEVAFTFYQNDMQLFNLSPGKLGKRILGVLGQGYQDQLIVCHEETPLLRIKGYIGKPSSAKKTRGDQYFFVNNRYIKSNYLHHAVVSAFEGLMAPDQHPFYTLFLEIDPSHIDINVHPTKTEIKFDDERTIYGVLKAAIKQSLGAHHVVPSIDFSLDVNFTDTWRQDTTQSQEVQSEHTYKNFNGPAFRKQDVSGWEKLFDNRGLPERGDEDSLLARRNEETETITFSSRANLTDQVDRRDLPEQKITGNTFQVESKYIIAQVSTGILLFDQQASHERILYERFVRQLDISKGASQQCLFPQTVNLSPADYVLVMELQEELNSLGFVVSSFGNHTVIINGVPADVAITNEKALFESLLEQFKHFKSELSLDKRENLARSLARRSAIKTGQKLSPQEMENLVGRLFACQNPNYSPTGNKTFVKLDLTKIDSFFNQ